MHRLIISRLNKEEENIRASWNSPNISNTRYFLIDNLLPGDITMEIFNAFPSQGENFNKRSSFRERKKTFAKLNILPKILTDITFAFQDASVIGKIEELTQMEDLEGDPKLYAGGLSMMFEGDFLNPHIDNSHDSERTRYRRLNLLFYVTPGWSLENGGNFELWDGKVTTPITIVSKFNRLVVMETNDKSWHSVNKVLVKTPRCCVSNYFFSQQSPKVNKNYYHVTSFMGRPEETLKRLWSRVDNFARQFIATKLGISRGRGLVNEIGHTRGKPDVS